jgi:putative oxidoreductase
MDSSALKSLFSKPGFGLLIIRAFTGGALAWHGYQKFAGGTDTLRFVGSAIRNIGINVGTDSVLALFFGIMAAGAELLGGALLIVGWMFRPAIVPMLCTMIVAILLHVSKSEGFELPLVYAAVLFGLFWTGPGRLSIQKD